MANNILETLPKERIWGEWEKLASKGIKPSMGLKALKNIGWITMFPELNDLIGCEQEPEWHPEGDAFEHTCQCIDAMAEIAEREGFSKEQKIRMFFGILCHDMGKPETTAIRKGRITSYGHAEAGIKIAESFMNRIGAPKDITLAAMEMTREHMCHTQFTKNPDGITSQFCRRFISRLNNTTPEEIFWIMEADHSGRGSMPKGLPMAAKRMQEICSGIGDKIEPIIQGRDIIKNFPHIKPGKEFGRIIKACFEAQIEGIITDTETGIAFIKTII